MNATRASGTACGSRHGRVKFCLLCFFSFLGFLQVFGAATRINRFDVQTDSEDNDSADYGNDNTKATDIVLFERLADLSRVAVVIALSLLPGVSLPWIM